MTKISQYFPVLFIISLIALIAPFYPLGQVDGLNVEKGIIALVTALLVLNIFGTTVYQSLLKNNPEKIKDSSLTGLSKKTWFKPLTNLAYFVFILAMLLQGQYIIMVIFMVLSIISHVLSTAIRDPLKALAKERGLDTE